MKTATKVSAFCGAALALVVLLNGCAEDNEKAAMVDTTGKVTKPITPKGTAGSSSDAYKAMQNNDPMRNNKNYQQK